MKKTRLPQPVETKLMNKFWQALAPLSGTQRRRVLDFLNSMHAEAATLLQDGGDSV